MIELGGNILLEGFEGLDPAQLIVIKKMIGNFTKIANENINLDSFQVIKENNKIKIKIKKADKELISEANEENLFYSLSKAALSIIAKTKTL
ncbi:MAG: hypothetical protein U9Q69_03775 [Nanoarchaeota archaeon]|nr:hypothetical protein [Nanoarchaeota archaeon]